MILLDTNILLRYASTSDPLYSVVDGAVTKLHGRGETLHLVPQNLYEFWAVATRPTAVNGLGLSTAECEAAVAGLKRLFPLLPDQPTLFAEWESLVAAHQCQGKTVHDARLVAAMRTHGLSQFLTLNAGDFRRYPWLTILEPAAVVSS